MPRRPRGVKKNASGTFSLQPWDPTTKKILTGFGSFATAEEAGRKIAEIELALRGGILVGNERTVLQQVETRAEGRGPTWRTLATRLRGDPLGAMRLQYVRPSDIERHLRRSTGAASTKRLNAKLLSAAFTAAVDDRLIASSPFTKKVRDTIPKSPRTARAALTVDQVRTIAGAMVQPRDAVMVKVMASTGCRISECLALRRDDVDLDAATIRIERQHDAHNRPAPLKHHGEPRTVPITGAMVAELRQHMAQHADPMSTGLLFVSRFGHPITAHTWRRLSWRPALAAAGLATTWHPHDLRHHCASTLLSQGAPLVTVASMLGHSVMVLSQTYAHALDGGLDLSRMALEAAWREPELSRSYLVDLEVEQLDGL